VHASVCECFLCCISVYAYLYVRMLTLKCACMLASVFARLLSDFSRRHIRAPVGECIVVCVHLCACVCSTPAAELAHRKQLISNKCTASHETSNALYAVYAATCTAPFASMPCRSHSLIRYSSNYDINQSNYVNYMPHPRAHPGIRGLAGPVT